jgi:hypothetical protein
LSKKSESYYPTHNRFILIYIMKNLIINILLFFIAIMLWIVLIPLGILYTLFYSIGNGRKATTYVSKSFLIVAYGIDCIGNVVCRDLFNSLLIKDGYQFGRWTETISSVLGKNERDNSLQLLWKTLVWILDKIDPNHCQKSIQEF